MAQISLPLRIALLAVLAAGALWMTVLKPKDAAEAPIPTAPGATGLANGVAAAKGAVAKSAAADAKTQAATGGTAAVAATKTGAHAAAGAKATPAATAPKKAAAAKSATDDRSAPLIRALDRRHAVVLLFWNRRGADDRAVRAAVARVPHRGGRVVVKAVPIAQVGRYEAITSGAQVLESPTTLVIGEDRKAHPIVGFTTTSEIVQRVGDTLAAATK